MQYIYIYDKSIDDCHFYSTCSNYSNNIDTCITDGAHDVRDKPKYVFTFWGDFNLD